MEGASSLLHATCIALDGRAALIMGPSGSGKSDLALRCLMSPVAHADRMLRAELVADDQVWLERKAGRLLVRAPEATRGKLEVRGLGIVAFPCVPEAELAVLVRLKSHGDIERLPDPVPVAELQGIAVPLLSVAAFDASASHKVLLALAAAHGGA